MISQHSLRVYCEPPPAAGQPAAPHPLYAVVFSAIVHFVVLGGASLLAVVMARDVVLPGVPQAPLVAVFTAFILACCSLGVILFVRSPWPLYWKVLAAVILSCFLWLLLLAGNMHSTQ